MPALGEPLVAGSGWVEGTATGDYHVVSGLSVLTGTAGVCARRQPSSLRVSIVETTKSGGDLAPVRW